MNTAHSSALSCALVLLLCACTPTRGGGSSKAAKEAAAAEALTHALQFQNANAKRIDGDLPDPSPGAPELVPDDDGGASTFNPGAAGAVTLKVSNARADDPVVSTLIQFAGAKQFISLPVDAGASGDTVTNAFTISKDVCADLCNIIHQVKCYESAMTKSGLVTKANLRTVALQCEEMGSATKCASSGTVQPAPAPDATSDAPQPDDTPSPSDTTTDTDPPADDVCGAWCGFAVGCGGADDKCVSECTAGMPDVPAACKAALEAVASCVSGKSCEAAASACATQIGAMSGACGG